MAGFFCALASSRCLGGAARMLVDAIDYGDDCIFDAGSGYAITVNQVAEFVIALTGEITRVLNAKSKVRSFPGR